jgi:O-succinylbenzoate synthase
VKLERIEVRKLQLPLRHPFETSFGTTTAKTFLLVSASSGGVTGYGECVAEEDPLYLPETNATVLHVLRDFLVPIAFSLEVSHPRDVSRAFAHIRGHNMAKAALEMAVWDLEARRQAIPLYRLIGGRGGEIASGVSIGLQKDEAALVARVEAEVAAGYRRIKIKIKPGRDLSLVEAVRKRFPKLPLMADANSAYTLEDTPLLQRLDAFDLMMVEQPLAWDDIVDHATLQRTLRPRSVSMSRSTPRRRARALELAACRIVNIKAGRVGGIAGSIAVHDVCRARGVPSGAAGCSSPGSAARQRPPPDAARVHAAG